MWNNKRHRRCNNFDSCSRPWIDNWRFKAIWCTWDLLVCRRWSFLGFKKIKFHLTMSCDGTWDTRKKGRQIQFLHSRNFSSGWSWSSSETNQMCEWKIKQFERFKNFGSSPCLHVPVHFTLSLMLNVECRSLFETCLKWTNQDHIKTLHTFIFSFSSH